MNVGCQWDDRFPMHEPKNVDTYFVASNDTLKRSADRKHIKITPENKASNFTTSLDVPYPCSDFGSPRSVPDQYAHA